MLDIIGVQIYHIDVDEDLRKKQSFDQGSEDILKESINEELNIDMDLSKMKPLTFNKITDYLKQEETADFCDRLIFKETIKTGSG